MKCPQHPGMVLLANIHRKYPGIKKAYQKVLKAEAGEADITSLIESPLSFDRGASADIVIKNALLFDEKGGTLKDIAISGNLITQVGKPGAIQSLIDDDTRILDAAGNSVLPGFTDSHLHLSIAMNRLRGCNMEDVTTVDEFKKRLREFADKKPDEKVLYVYGLHYYDPPIIPAQDCRHFLDEIVKERPLLVFAHDLHTCWANTKAVELAGLLHPLPPYPPLIEELDMAHNFILGSDKMPSGEFREPEVYFFVSGPIAAMFPRSITEQLEDLETVCKQLAGLGITSVHRMALAQPSQDLSFLLMVLELDHRGRLPIRIATSCASVADTHMLYDAQQAYLVRAALSRARRKEMSMAELHDYLVELLKDSGTTRQKAIEEIARKDGATRKHPYINRVKKATEHIHNIIHKTYVKSHARRKNPYREEKLPEFIRDICKVRCDTIKIFMDGVIEKKTAYRLDQNPEEGIPEFKQGELDALLEYADRFGMQVAAHSIGNGSVRSMLDAISRARQKNREIDKNRGHRIPHRIEHIEMCKAEDIPRFGKDHIVASMQPLHERPPVTMWHKMVPEKDWDSSFAWKEISGDGAVIVFGSDWPIVSCDVRKGLHHATTRQPWVKGEKQQKLTIRQALDAYTIGSAFTEYSGKIKGKIEPGMLADIVILSDNVNKLAEEEQPEIDIQTTICDGEIVYENEKV